MDVDDAWAFSTGNGVKIAVIDTGVDFNHPDLVSNLLTGYDATGGNSNGNQSGNPHGTCCAGIISAIGNNNVGTVGIAYNAKIIPVRVFPTSGAPSDNMLANGITWAYQNGADILSNSWGGGHKSDAITNAINNAVNFGRNGKGCLVLFSSGNHNTDVAYPATLPNVVAVGATNMFDERKSPATAYHDECWYSDCHGGSNYGAEIDVVAPGVFIYTTDISGSAGYNYGDYKSNFNGTSAACPQAAGVSALILSINPDLNYHQVREILEGSTDIISGYTYTNSSDHPNGTWNNEVGYGRINAYNAVVKTLDYAEILGDNSACYNSTYYISGIPDNVTVTWTTSSNLQITNSTNLNVTVRPINNNVSESGYIEAHFEGKVKRKNIWVGKSKMIYTKIGSCYEPIYRISSTYPDVALEFKVNHNGNTQYYSGSSHYEVSPDDYNLQDGQATTIFINIRNMCGWSNTFPLTIVKPTLCDCGYDNPGCGGSDGPPTLLDADISDKISIYPIPSKDVLHINLGSNKVSLINLTAISGQVVDEIIPKENIIHYDVSKYPNGIYMMKIITENKTFFKKIIINHQ